MLFIIMGLIILLIFLISFSLSSKRKVTSLQSALKKYDSIINLELEKTKLSNEIDSIKSQISKEKSEWDLKKSDLISSYKSAQNLYSQLNIEVQKLNETLEMASYGIYSPHFDFDSPEDYKINLERNINTQKNYIKNDLAVKCNTKWSVEGNIEKGNKKTKNFHNLMLKAFNGECDALISKVDWNNVVKYEERIKKTYESINSLAKINDSQILPDYLGLKLNELYLTYEYKNKVHLQKEEQRRIKEEMKEEEKALREFERAKEKAEKEEEKFKKALLVAKEELQKAHGDKVDSLNQKILELEQMIKEAEENKQRAISMAQQTKSGHVYIISNIGSFGDNVYKIGMTRRLDPEDRVKELGDASVPFPFDIHAMIYSDNAPELENKLHNVFSDKKVNLVNNRKEFFYVHLDEIKDWAQKNKYNLDITLLAEAREYRESFSLRSAKTPQIKSENEGLEVNIEDLFNQNS